MKLRHIPVLLLVSASASTALGESGAGTIKRLQGPSQIVSSQGTRAAEVGGVLYPGDEVVTGSASAVGLTLHDGTRMAIGPNAKVSLQGYRFDATTREGSLLVDVARGALRMVSGLLAKENPRAVAVRTPTATIGIRGTDFIVDVDGQSAQ